MKRIAIILSALCLSLTGKAQTDSIAVSDDTTQPGCSDTIITVDLGLSAGVSLLSDNSGSPYYSKYGFTLQIPLMAHWQFAPQWKLSAGLRYDFNWNPLFYNVDFNADRTGITFLSEPTTATRRGLAFSSYVGIPVNLRWYPRATRKANLGLAVDLFAGYAVSSNINIDEHYVNSIDNTLSHAMNLVSNSNRILSTVQPWKIEVGFSLTTDQLGLFHGLRLFANLLPTYIDPATDTPVYTSGITMFL